jgi:hypothetical protein
MSENALPVDKDRTAVSIAGLELRRAFVDDVSQLKRVYAKAFYNDPIVEWMIPDERSRHRRLTSYGWATARPSG